MVVLSCLWLRYGVGVEQLKEIEREKRKEDSAKISIIVTPQATESEGSKSQEKKEKKKKFRYESKAERKFTRGKQKAGNKARADARKGSG